MIQIKLKISVSLILGFLPLENKIKGIHIENDEILIQ